MNPLRLSCKIRVKRADNDAGRLRLIMVQPYKMAAINGEHSAIFRLGESQNFVIRNRLVGFAGFLDCQDIVPESPKSDNHRQRKILV